MLQIGNHTCTCTQLMKTTCNTKQRPLAGYNDNINIMNAVGNTDTQLHTKTNNDERQLTKLALSLPVLPVIFNHD